MRAHTNKYGENLPNPLGFTDFHSLVWKAIMGFSKTIPEDGNPVILMSTDTITQECDGVVTIHFRDSPSDLDKSRVASVFVGLGYIVTGETTNNKVTIYSLVHVGEFTEREAS